MWSWIRRWSLRLVLGLSLLIAAVTLNGTALARPMAFDGEPEDHFWNVDFTACRNGFQVSGHEIAHDDGNGGMGYGDDLPYKFVLTGMAAGTSDGPWDNPSSPVFLAIRAGDRIVTPNLTAGLLHLYQPSRPLPNGVILSSQRGGPGHEPAEFERVFRFVRTQRTGNMVTITLERWDHGINSADENNNPNPDSSGSYAGAYDDVSGLGTHLPPLTVRVQDCSLP